MHSLCLWLQSCGEDFEAVFGGRRDGGGRERQGGGGVGRGRLGEERGGKEYAGGEEAGGGRGVGHGRLGEQQRAAEANAPCNTSKACT